MTTYGIDLGTTYSCIAKLDANGNPQVISNISDAADTLASVIYFETLDNVIIGQSAKEYLETDGERVVQFFKREIGREDEYEPHIIDGQKFTPVELSSLILKRIKEMAEDQGEEVKDVIITCPAYFGFKERDLTKKAGQIVGLNVINLINEPTAAALNYCSRLFQEDKNILVYDLGGGTFDVTLINMSIIPKENEKDARQIKVLATGGNSLLGGKDWDDKLYQIIRNKVCKQLSISTADLDIETIQTIRSKVEIVKKKLSQAIKVTLKINVRGETIKIMVTRNEFEKLTKPLVDKTMRYVESTLKKVNRKNGKRIKIDTVLLVGGATYMPMIRSAVKAKFPGLVQIEDPDRAVAKGAAIYADMLVREINLEQAKNDNKPTSKGKEKNPKKTTSSNHEHAINHQATNPIIEVAPRSFGPAVYFDKEYLIDNLVKEGEEIGKKIKKQYKTMVDNQAELILPVYESHSLEDREKPCYTPHRQTGKDIIPQETNPSLEVKKLGELVLELNSNNPKGTIVYVEFTVQPVGIIVKVTLSTDLSVTKEETITFDNGISKEDIKKISEKINRVSVSSD